MEEYEINGQIITNLTTATEGNALIMRKGRTSLLSAKVMLFALLRVENRTPSSANWQSLPYYRKLLADTMVDYTKGLVAEIDVSDLRRLLQKENSGSFYTSLRELFSIDPHERKSLRNSWAVMLPNHDSGVLGYAEVIIACHYDVANGKLFIKFSDEEFIKSQIWSIRSGYTELPFLHMLNIKSIYTYRLYEILYSEMVKVGAMSCDLDCDEERDYYFRFAVGELQLMMGVLDVISDTDARKSIATNQPDYNAIVRDVNVRQRENMGEYRSFRRYSLDVATSEINETESSAFTAAYDVEREEGSRRVAYVVFKVRKKNQQGEMIATSKDDSKTHIDFIVEVARILNKYALSYDELSRVAVIAKYDQQLIKTAEELYQKLNNNESFVSWFAELCKK